MAKNTDYSGHVIEKVTPQNFAHSEPVREQLSARRIDIENHPLYFQHSAAPCIQSNCALALADLR